MMKMKEAHNEIITNLSTMKKLHGMMQLQAEDEKIQKEKTRNKKNEEYNIYHTMF